jgi:hypothetical protein
MIKYIICKEILYAILCAFIIQITFKNFNLITINRQSEGMMNVESHKCGGDGDGLNVIK